MRRLAWLLVFAAGFTAPAFGQCPTSGAATPQSPSGQNYDAGATITFSWTAASASGVSGYDVLYAPFGSGNQSVACSAAANATSCTMSAPASAGTYNWTVRTNISSCTGLIGTGKTFTVGCPQTAPTLSSPSNGATNVPTFVTLSWNSVPLADSYDIYIGPTGTGSAGCSSTSPNATSSTTSFNPPQLQANTTYEWKVVAKRSGSSCPGAASACGTFTTTANSCNAPGSFTLASPAAFATVSNPVTVAWNAASGASKYVVHISSNNPPTAAANDPVVSNTTYTTNLAPGNYYWYVDAYPSCSTTVKTSSPVSNFTVASSCPTGAPSLVAPAADAQLISGSVTFQWTGNADANGYEIDLSSDGGASFGAAGSVSGASATTFTKALAAGNYIWLVRALYNNGCAPVASGKQSFSIVSGSNCPTPAAATLLSPANGAMNVASPINFDWSDVAGASGYRLVASFNGAAPSAIAATSDSEASVSVPAGAVEWWVEAIMGPGCPAIVSQHATFTAIGASNCPANPGTPSLVTPANGANVASPVTLSWTAVAGVSSYRVYASSATSRVVLGTVTSPQLTVSLPAGTITWLVEARFDGCPSTFSSQASFTVTAGSACGATPTTLATPANGATNVQSPVAFGWTAVPGAVGYNLYIGSSATAGDLAGATTDTTLTRILAPGTYYWWVDTAYAGCPDVHGTPQSFTVVAPNQCAGGTITLAAPAPGATVNSPVTLQWSALQGVTAYRVWAATNGGAPAVLARSSDTKAQVSFPAGSVEWWIEGLFSTCPSVMSAHSTFTVQQAQTCGSNTPPTITSPTGTTVQSPVTFTWTAVPKVAYYRVWISVNGDPAVDIGVTKSTSLDHDVLPGSVQWYVEAIFDDCPPVPSAKATFTVQPPVCSSDAPMIVSPADASKGVAAPVTLVWSAVSGAIDYRVFASLDGGDTRLIAKTSDASITKVLPAGTVKWWVEAVFDSCPSTKSAKATFTIAKKPNCPTSGAALVAPADGANNVSPQNVHFDWDPVSGAIGYALFLRHNDGAATKLVETTETDFVHDLPPGAIEWWVTTFVNGCDPIDSAHATFTIVNPACGSLLKPLLQSPPDGPTPIASPVHLAWSAVPKATSYKVWAATDGNVPTVIGSTTDKKLTVNLPSGAITWFVEAVFENCPSTKSAPGTFAVQKSAPPCASPFRPSIKAPGSVQSGTQYTVRWTPEPNATTFELQESATSDFANATTSEVTGYEATFTHTATKATRWYYRVRAISNCSDDRSAYSRIVAVVVAPPVNSANHATVEVGTTGAISQQINLPPHNPAVSFTAHGDKPWITVTPSSGTVGPNGFTLTVTFDPAALNLGANTGSVIVTYGASGKGGSAPNAASSGVPVSVSIVTPVQPGGTNTPPPDALVIPAVGHAPGANNSMFESDVRVANVSSLLQKYNVTFTLTNTDGTQSSNTTSIQIDPGTTMALDDILASFFGIGATGDAATGVLQIRPTSSPTSSFASSSQPSVQTVASSRTYNNTPNGTYGQYIPAIPFAQFIANGTNNQPNPRITLQQIAQSAAYRTNFGLVEASGETANVVVHVFDNAGNELAQIPETLKPSSQIQINNFLAANNLSLTDGRIEVEVTSPTGKVTAYASVVDNQTNDPLLVLPVIKGSTTSSHYVLPGIAALTNGFANWQSDMRIFNGGSSAANVTLAYVPQPGNPGTQQTTSFTIAPGEVKAIDNALQTLYGVSNSGGSIVITTDQPASLVATARTYNQTNAGTYGQFIPAVASTDGVGVGGRTLQVLQLESSSRYRTNLGVVETSGNPATVQVSAITPDAKVAASTTVSLTPNEFYQFSLDNFGLGTVYNTRVTVKVLSGTGRVTAYASVIDQTTQDPTYVPAQ